MNIRAAWYVLISKAFVVATDKIGIMHIPHLDPYSLNDVLILGAQQQALTEMYDKLGDMIKEHQLRIKQLRRK